MKKVECDKCHKIVGVHSASETFVIGLGKQVDLCTPCYREYEKYMIEHSKAFFNEGSNENV